MTTTLTLIDDKYSANDGAGRKRLFFTISCLRPISTGGDVLDIGTGRYFGNKMLGGNIVAIDPNVSVAGAGLLNMGRFRADTTSTASVILQIFNVGVGANFGNMIDNTINVQAATATVVLEGY